LITNHSAEMKKNFLAIMLLLLPCLIYSQSSSPLDSSWIKVMTKNPDADLFIDGKSYKSGTLLRIDSGTHIIRGKAYGTIEVEKEVRCIPNKLKLVRFDLPYTEDYEAHLKSLKKYKRKKKLVRYGPAIIFTVYAVYSFNQLSKLNDEADDNLRQAESFKRSYESSFWDTDLEENLKNYEFFKEEYDKNLEEIDKIHTQQLIGLGVTAGLTITGWYISSKWVEPTFTEGSALRHLQLSPVVSPNFNGIHLNYRF